MATKMDAVTTAISNPLIRASLGPQALAGLELANVLYGTIIAKYNSHQLVNVIDAQLASYARELSTAKSRVLQRELEIRIHTLLGVLNEWEKIT